MNNSSKLQDFNEFYARTIGPFDCRNFYGRFGGDIMGNYCL